MKVYDLNENRKLQFEDECCVIIRDSIIPDNRIRKIAYENIIDVVYQPRKIFWMHSIFKFLLFFILQNTENPAAGVVKRLVIILKDGGSRKLEIDSVDDQTIQDVVDEFKKRMNIKYNSHPTKLT